MNTIARSTRRTLMLVLSAGLVASAACQNSSRAAGPIARATPRGEAAGGHLKLTGDYTVDHDSLTTCAMYPNHSFQVALTTPQSPYVFLYVKNFAGPGTYAAEARVRANYSGEGMRVSRAATQTEIRVAPAPKGGQIISGSFSGSFSGEGGKGTIAGSFDRCRYQPVAS